MKHLVMYSGGLGSYDAARLAISRYGEAVDLLFTDTLHEDADLYRFLVDSVADLFGTPATEEIKKALSAIGPIELEGEDVRRKTTLKTLAELCEGRWPKFHWVTSNETLWESFDRNHALGSSRLQFCSRDLKIFPSNAFINARYRPGEVKLHFGLDWMEEIRLDKVIERRDPHIVSVDYFNWTLETLRSQADIIELLNEKGIEIPKLYTLGFTHNNCSGFCVKAGQKHFAHLLATKPELYRYAEAKEEAFRQRKQKNVSILKDRIGVKPGEKARPLTMRQLRERIEGGGEVDSSDIGKCGCILD